MTPPNSRACARALDDALRLARGPDTSGWRGRHLSAVTTPRHGFESGIVGMLRALAEYADEHSSRFGTGPDPTEPPGAVDETGALDPARPFGIGSDYVLGDAWLDGLSCVHQLLNGELGRLDGGMLDGACRALARTAGFTDAECQDFTRERRTR